MPQPENQELGIRSTLSLRVGIAPERFRGMDRESDPGALSVEDFYLLENVRLNGGAILCRPGLVSEIDDALDGCVIGIWDDRNESLFSLVWV